MTNLERILVTVRTYPTISAKYTETVCTGGINEQGEWRRLYPVPLRYLDSSQQYKTYDIIKVRLTDKSDGRMESRRPDNTSIVIESHLDSWKARRQWIDPTVANSLREFEEKQRTIGPIRVKRVIDFTAKPIDPEWSAAEKEKLKQENLFAEIKHLEKVPFEFRIQWEDGDGVPRDSMFQAWEVGQTWRQYRLDYSDPIAVMRDKWLNDICGADREVSFFMGNIAKRRQVFMVCGIYNPPVKSHSDGQTLWSNHD